MKYLPDKSCEVCKGHGYVPSPEDPTQTMYCGCVVRNNALEYLGSTYKNAQLLENIPLETLEHKDLLFDGNSINIFKTYVKSFLIATCMKYTHLSVSAKEVADASFTDDPKSPKFIDLSIPDLLFVYLTHDFNNKAYFELISNLITKRSFKGKNTWIFSEKNIDSPEFMQKYSKNLSDFLQSKGPGGFTRMAQGVPVIPKEPAAPESVIPEGIVGVVTLVAESTPGEFNDKKEKFDCTTEKMWVEPVEEEGVESREERVAREKKEYKQREIDRKKERKANRSGGNK